mgnify:CR=1 FL=1|jgi:hypothetical protein
MRRKPAVRLSSSERILFFPDGSCDNGVLVNLLLEAHEKGVHPLKKILVTEKTRDLRLNEWGYDEAYKLSLEDVRHYELLEEWKGLYGVDEGGKYSPEAEDERNRFEMVVIRNRSAFPVAMGNFMKAYGNSLGA